MGHPRSPATVDAGTYLFARCIPVPEAGCWLFEGANNQGYGTLWYDGRCYRAHRLAWIAAHGAIPSGLHVCHKCDTPTCCNPQHLFLGTNLENRRDRASKGRHGAVHHSYPKLGVSDIRAIRASSEPTKAVARRLGVNATTVRDLRAKRTWRDVK